MPNQKFILGIALVAVILFGLNLKPDLLGSDINNFMAGLSSPSLACNSPALLKGFHQRFDEHLQQATPDRRKALAHYALHIKRTETLGQVGNTLSCSMDYTLEEGGSVGTFVFLLSKDDDNKLIWRHNPFAIPPYEELCIQC